MRFLDWRRWNLLGAAIWVAITLGLALGLDRAASNSDLPDSVRVLAGVLEVVIAVVGMVILLLVCAGWVRRSQH